MICPQIPFLHLWRSLPYGISRKGSTHFQQTKGPVLSFLTADTNGSREKRVKHFSVSRKTAPLQVSRPVAPPALQACIGLYKAPAAGRNETEIETWSKLFSPTAVVRKWSTGPLFF